MNVLKRRQDLQVFRVIWPFLAVIVVLVGLGAISVGVMSSLRAFIAGESVWSKGEKDGIFYLSQYTEFANEEFYNRYQVAVAGPRSLRNARIALYSNEPNIDAAAQWLINGGIDRQDVPDAIRTFKWFRRSHYLQSTVSLWSKGDVILDRLDHIAQTLHTQLAVKVLSVNEKAVVQSQIRAINASINPLSLDFSKVLSDFYRATASLLQKLNLLAAACLFLLSTAHVRRTILQRGEISEALSRSEARAKATLSSIGEAVIATDPSGHIEFMNAAAESVLGFSYASCLNKKFTEVFNLVDEATLAHVDPFSHNGEINRLAILMRDDDSQVFVHTVTSRISLPHQLRGNTHGGFVIILRDVSREKAHVEELAWRATHDNLTGLIGRAEFEQRLQTVIDRKVERSLGVVTLLFLDLDRFKIVNDTCGHAAGDLLLQKIADTLQSCVTSTSTVARLGGDEFGVMLSGTNASENEATAEAIRVRLDVIVFKYENESFTISASVGLLHLTSEITTVAEAMKLSDIACYIAKGRGRDRIHIVDPKDGEIIRQVSDGSWTRRLERALGSDDFILFAQPIADIKLNDTTTENRTRAELLLRLYDPDDNTITTPNLFIPAAERYGLMPAIDKWVVSRTLATLAATNETLYSEYGINVSGASIGDERFLAFVKREFEQTRVRPSLICFEITETTAVANFLAAETFMIELRELGCHFALDDFGVGVSSFGYLKSLPVDYLKIDGGFIKDIVSDKVSLEMVNAINDIGHAMKCKTIAEYVESEDILEVITRIGIDYAQGYFFGRPARWVEEQRFVQQRVSSNREGTYKR